MTPSEKKMTVWAFVAGLVVLGVLGFLFKSNGTFASINNNPGQGASGSSVTSSSIATAGGLLAINNLSDVGNSSTALGNIGGYGNNFSVTLNYPQAGSTFPVNSIHCWGYPVSFPVQFSRIAWLDYSGDASTTDLYDLGIYQVSSTAPTVMSLIADTGPLSNTSGVHTASTTQGSVTLYPNNSQNYFECITGTSSTAQYGYGTSQWDYANNSAQSNSSGGQLPTTSTVPAVSWGSAALPSIVLYH